MKINDNIICGVAPGWIFCGRVTEINAGEFTLAPAAWIESVSEPWPTAIQKKGGVTKYNPIKVLRIQRSALLWDSEAPASLIYLAETSAIQGVN